MSSSFSQQSNNDKKEREDFQKYLAKSSEKVLERKLSVNQEVYGLTPYNQAINYNLLSDAQFSHPPDGANEQNPIYHDMSMNPIQSTPLTYQGIPNTMSDIPYQCSPDIMSYPQNVISQENKNHYAAGDTTVSSVMPPSESTQDVMQRGIDALERSYFSRIPSYPYADCTNTLLDGQSRQIYLHSGLENDSTPSVEKPGSAHVIYPCSYKVTIQANYPPNAIQVGDKVTTSPSQTRVYREVSEDKGATIDRFLRQ
ncbi:uncharacterized protein I206_101350 [Kwoniella pini CBS 10737]|uniref:Uncharacterized protein n=1 Tax=Kwoniella pini CBS 10737 TaxID=1296096 RepID=A0A1B9HWY0_9TREE|nr:uncharacterized protein I206_06682 [Kwoniella pini CBS 10737]OCF47775.1 hypothetical protein I206_06682 [Kwoniella pini CBS 10737]